MLMVVVVGWGGAGRGRTEEREYGDTVDKEEGCHYRVSSSSLTPSTSGLLIAGTNLIRVCRQIS